MTRIYVTPTMLIDTQSAARDVLEQAGFEVVFPPKEASLEESARYLLQLPDIEGMLASNDPLDRTTLQQSQLRVIARMGVGYDSIDIPSATELGILVTTTPGAVEACVAEHTVALLLAVARDIVTRDKEVRSHHWSRTTLPRLAGKTIGLIGLGRIGKQVVPKVAGLGMNIVAYDPFPDEQFAAEYKIEYTSLDELFTRCDVVSLHVPSLPETYNLIDQSRLKQMKQGAILVNTSRGALVDEAALASALHSGKLRGAGIDVYKIEPPEPDNPLLTAPNALLCTHMGGLDDQSVIDMSVSAAQSLVDLHQGNWPEGKVVNHELKENWKW